MFLKVYTAFLFRVEIASNLEEDILGLSATN